MSDFSQEDLFEAIDRAVREMLQRAGISEPPVDALHMAQAACGYRIQVIEAEEDAPDPHRRPRSTAPYTITIREDQSEESQQAVAARAVAKAMVQEILSKLGVAPGTENRGAGQQLVGIIAPRLLLPTNWFSRDVRKVDFDLLELKDRYPNVGFEWLAWRMLDVAEDPCVITIVDDGSVAARRSNRFTAGRKLTRAEEECVAEVARSEEPQRVRCEGWIAWGWPTPGIPFRRIIVRAVPDDI